VANNAHALARVSRTERRRKGKADMRDSRQEVNPHGIPAGI
jgi:hypothetical protein